MNSILFSVNWVPLDEYYYGKSEGDLSYAEEKNEFRFKVSFHCCFCSDIIHPFNTFMKIIFRSQCWFCNKMLYNNIKDAYFVKYTSELSIC